MAKKDELNDQQYLFVKEYIVDWNGKQAAIRAEYSPRSAEVTASKLLRMTKVQKAIQIELMNRVERIELDQDYVLQNLIQVVERCMQRQPVMVRDGKEMVQMRDEEGRHVWQFNHQGVNKALELLGKHLGIFQENINLNVETNTADRITRSRNRLKNTETEKRMH